MGSSTIFRLCLYAETIIGIILTGILLILLHWFLISQIAKRSHDIGNSGWHLLIPVYPIFLLFVDSDYGENQYGANPKGIGNNI